MEKNYGFKKERARKYSKQVPMQNNFDSGEGVGRERIIALRNLLFVTLRAVSSIIYLPLGVVIILTSTIISSLIYINKNNY